MALRASKKRSARTKRAGHSPKKAENQKPKTAEELKKERNKKLFEAAVVAFGVLMALGMMLPALAPIFSHQQQENARNEAKEQAKKQQEQDEKDAEAASDQSDDKNDPDSMYKKSVDKLTKTLKDDPNNLPALLNLAAVYAGAGERKLSDAGTDAEKMKEALGILQKSLDTYDAYLKINDSPAARVNRCMVLYAMRDFDKAQQGLQDVLNQHESYPPALLNLGIIAMQKQDYDGAENYFNQAKQADENGEYGVARAADAYLLRLNDAKNKKDGKASGDGAGSQDASGGTQENPTNPLQNSTHK